MLDIIKKFYLYFPIIAMVIILILFFTDSGVQEDISKIIKSGSKTGSKTGKNTSAMILLVGGVIGYGICYMTKDNIESMCKGDNPSCPDNVTEGY